MDGKKKMSNLVYNPGLHVGCENSFSSLQLQEKSYNEELPYKCKFCSQRFPYPSNLQKHERSHTKERPYTCNFCNRTFTQKSNLQVHKRIHTAERPFQCKLCGRSFRHSSNLQRHLRRFQSCSSSNQNSELNTELLQNSGPVNVTSNVATQNIDFKSLLEEHNYSNSQTILYNSPKPNTSQVYVSENRNYASKDEIYKCELCSSFNQEHELDLHYCAHFEHQ